MSARWFPSGVTSLDPVRLSSEERESIRLELRARGVDEGHWEVFACDIEVALAAYQAMTGLSDKSKPAAVRKNLRTSLDAALRLNDSLNHLDANSRTLLGKAVNGGISAVNNHLSEIIMALSEAGHKADEMPTKGRLPDYARQELAVAVLEALQYCGVTPTTTKEGLYHNVLAVVLEIATGKPVNAVHDLVEKAMKQTKRQNVQVT